MQAQARDFCGLEPGSYDTLQGPHYFGTALRRSTLPRGGWESRVDIGLSLVYA